MAERDPRNNKKYFGNINKDKKDVLHLRSNRQPIILAKPDRDRDSERDKDKSTELSSANKNSERPQPTISILRTREGEHRAVSPNQRVLNVSKKDTDSQPTVVYQLAAKHASGENANPLAPYPEMKSSMKLLDEMLQFSDSSLEYLVDQNDFTVIGCLGMQGVGKSTIMSLLAGNTCEDILKSPLIFSPVTFEQQELGSHCTSGIDLYVTSNRIIFLDTQPMLSASVMDRLINLESKKFAAPDFSSTENAIEIQSLQIAAFMLSVCHVILIVQDWFFDPNFMRFLQTAEMLKPSTPTTNLDEEIIEYFPHIMFLQNQTQSSDFSQHQVQLMQDVYRKMFLQSKLKIQSGMGLATGDIVHYLNPSSCGDPINLYLLSDINESVQRGHFKGHPGMKVLLQKLEEQLLSVSRPQLMQTVLSEKNWLHYCAKVWEAITKKSSFFMEYSRLLP